MPFAKKRKGKIIGWAVLVRMREKQKSQLCHTKTEAKDKEAEFREEIKRELSKTTPTVLEWQTRYLEFCEARFVPKTFEEKRDMASIACHNLG